MKRQNYKKGIVVLLPVLILSTLLLLNITLLARKVDNYNTNKDIAHGLLQMRLSAYSCFHLSSADLANNFHYKIGTTYDIDDSVCEIISFNIVDNNYEISLLLESRWGKTILSGKFQMISGEVVYLPNTFVFQSVDF
jgi:hypothetical protein